MRSHAEVLLVNPPGDRLIGRYRDFFPLGLASLAGALGAAGVDAAVYNAEAPRRRGETAALRQTQMRHAHRDYLAALGDRGHPVWTEAEEIFRGLRPSLVGLTVWTEKVDAARVLSGIVRRALPGTVVVWGGPHPTARPEECLGFPEVDLVVRGEGERTLTELALHLRDGGGSPADVPGVFSRDGDGGGLCGTARPLEPDIDALPLPGWTSGASDEDWPARTGGEQSLLTSRGCPYRCRYCAVHSVWGTRVRYHSVERVLAEIDGLARLTGSRRFTFWDDSFTLRKRRVEALCRALIERGDGIEWSCLTRCNLVDEGLLALMKRAGCRSVNLGVESGSPRMLEMMEKGQTVDDVARTAAAFRRAGMPFNAYYMIGFPDETEADLRMTIAHMRTVGADHVSLNVFTPYPGTPLFDRVVTLGLLPDPPEWSRYGRHSGESRFAASIPPGRFRELAREAFRAADRVNEGGLFRRLRRLAGRAVRRGRPLVG